MVARKARLGTLSSRAFSVAYIRGDCPNFEPSVVLEPYFAAFLHQPDRHLLAILSLGQCLGA
jgi:hypothetical protein